MANNNWAPRAVAVKEKITVTVGGTLAGEDFKLGLGDPAGADEIQAAWITGTGSGGTFTLVVPLPNGDEMTTAAIAYNANAEVIEAALDTAFALQSPAPPAGSISVAGTNMDTDDIIFTFDGAVYEKKDWPLVTFDDLATGWSAGIFAELVKGLPITGLWIAEHTDATTTIADTVAALVAAWNASKHPWAEAVTAVDASPNITLEADTAGVPFGDFLTDTDQTWESGVRGYYEIALNTPGESATLEQDETTANKGPNCANVAANWMNGTYLSNGEDVTIADSGVDILWGLDYGTDGMNKVLLNSLDIRKSMTGKIGLDYATFNGLTSAPEYRGTYFQILVDQANGDVTIGKHVGPGAVLGSRRIKLDLLTQQCRVEMHGSNSQPFESGKPAVRILLDNTNSIVHVLGAPGGFGIAVDQSSETSEMDKLAINCRSLKDRIYTGPGVTLTSETMAFAQNGGYCLLRHAPSDGGADKIPVVQLDDGVLKTEGDFQIDEFSQDGGVFYPNHWNSDAGEGSLNKAIEVAKFNAGLCDATRSMRARTWDDVTEVLEVHTLKLHGTAVTITAFAVVAPGGVGGI